MASRARKSISLALAIFFLLGGTCLAASHALGEFSRLVRKDTELTGNEKLAWIRLAKNRFDRQGYRTDYERILYAYLKLSIQGAYDQAGCLKAATAAVEAAEMGAPEPLLRQMGELILVHGLSKDQILFYTTAMERACLRGVPENLALDMLAHGLAAGWSAPDHHRVLKGVTELVAQGVPPDLAALYIHYWESRLPGPPRAFVAKAIENIPESSKGSLRKLPERARAMLAGFRTTVAPWLGTPYQWGGMSQEGADCSGFTREILNNVGCELPRVSRDQARMGHMVRKSDLQPGDLVFFDMELKGLISHVGLYLGGDLMAHASSSRGVIIIPFSNRYFQQRFVTARRVLNGETG